MINLRSLNIPWLAFKSVSETTLSINLGILGFSVKKGRTIEAEGPEGGSLGEKVMESLGFLLNHISVSIGLEAITISWKVDVILSGFSADLISVRRFPLTRDNL